MTYAPKRDGLEPFAERVRRALRREGRATAAEVGRGIGRPANVVSRALRAEVAAGRVREMRDGAAVLFELVDATPEVR